MKSIFNRTSSNLIVYVSKPCCHHQIRGLFFYTIFKLLLGLEGIYFRLAVYIQLYNIYMYIYTNQCTELLLWEPLAEKINERDVLVEINPPVGPSGLHIINCPSSQMVALWIDLLLSCSVQSRAF